MYLTLTIYVDIGATMTLDGRIWNSLLGVLTSLPSASIARSNTDTLMAISSSLSLTIVYVLMESWPEDAKVCSNGDRQEADDYKNSLHSFDSPCLSIILYPRRGPQYINP